MYQGAMRSVKKAIKTRNKAYKKGKNTMNREDLMKYKRKKGVVQRAVQKAKKRWRKYCGKRNKDTKTSEVHRQIKTMNGIQNRGNSVPVLIIEDTGTKSCNKQKLEVLAEIVHNISNVENQHIEICMRKKISKENQENWKRWDEDEDIIFNENFCVRELQKATDESKNSTLGMDGVYNKMLKHLDEGSLKILLKP